METDNQIKYVVGFAFSPDLSFVALIKKLRPAWQKGLLNGIGGKIEPGEDALSAMVREFQEETGCKTRRAGWKYYALMRGINNDGNGFSVHCYAIILESLDYLKSQGDELISIVKVPFITGFYLRAIDNLPWLILLGIDCLQDGRPDFVTIEYK